MRSLHCKKGFYLGFIFIFLMVFPAYALITPPDPFDSTDRFALLIPISDGSITKVTAKVKAPGEEPLGSGELWALIQYKITPSPGGKAFHFAASQALSIQSLSNITPALTDFIFSEEPIPAGAYHLTLSIYYQEDPEIDPVLVSEYRPEQLLLRPSGDVVETSLNPEQTAQGDQLILGPVTILRERETPITEEISFTVSDTTGPFLLRLTNGTSEGTHRIASAVVKLNGQEVFIPSEFSQKVAGLSRQVTLLSGTNLLEVRLRSVPGSFVTLELLRLDGNICRAFGPQTFLRSTGKPIKENVSFDLSPQLSGPFTLSLTNGDSSGSDRVDSAVITLNGQQVFGSSDFNEQTSNLTETVSLQSTNTLSAELFGSPGDFLSIEISGYDNTIPQVTITSPSSGTVVNTSPITVTGNVDDPYASVAVNGVTATVAPDGTFTADGVPLEEGDNVIKVVATDACGNQGEEQVLVSLQTAPEGPELTLCAEPFREQVPTPPGEDCSEQAFARYTGLVTGLTTEAAVSVTLNGILLPDGIEIYNQGDIFWGMREGNFFWAFVIVPQVDGIHPFTAVVTDDQGGQTEATVTFLRDATPPQLTITSPPEGLLTNTQTITITGTVDDPEATVRLGWFGPIIPVVDGTFTTEVNLSREGRNSLNITARDPYRNSSNVRINVYRDTIPPAINVTNPTEGMAVNVPTLDVAGTITDVNIGTASVAVNSGTPLELTLAGSNFSGSITLDPGQNTLLFEAIDGAGNTNTLTRTAILDQESPIVAITSPLPDTEISGIATITVDASDVQSGIDNVTLLVDGQVQETLNQSPFDFQLDTIVLVPGFHTLTARATDNAGNQSETSISVSVPIQVGIEILSPLDGATINESTALIEGTILLNSDVETGVVINGINAQIQGSSFAAIVPLQAGPNTITANATTADGLTAQDVITINTDTLQEFIRLTANPSSGIPDSTTGTLEVTMQAEVSLPNPVSQYQWDIEGDGVIDQSGSALSEVTGSYTTQGFYYPTVTVTDTLGNTYTATTIVNVLSLNDMDTLLKNKWNSMKDALVFSDIEGALNYFLEGSEEKYREIFNLLSSELPSLAAAMEGIQFLYIKGNTAKYRIRRNQTINGQQEAVTYYIYFMRDENGLWKIVSF